MRSVMTRVIAGLVAVGLLPGLAAAQSEPGGVRQASDGNDEAKTDYPATSFHKELTGGVIHTLPFFIVIRREDTGDIRRFEFGKFTKCLRDGKEMDPFSVKPGMKVRVLDRKNRELLKVEVLEDPPSQLEQLDGDNKVEAVKGTITEVRLGQDVPPSLTLRTERGHSGFPFNTDDVRCYLDGGKADLDQLKAGMPVVVCMNRVSKIPHLILATADKDKDPAEANARVVKDLKIKPVYPGQRSESPEEIKKKNRERGEVAGEPDTAKTTFYRPTQVSEGFHGQANRVTLGDKAEGGAPGYSYHYGGTFGGTLAWDPYVGYDFGQADDNASPRPYYRQRNPVFPESMGARDPLPGSYWEFNLRSAGRYQGYLGYFWTDYYDAYRNGYVLPRPRQSPVAE